MSTQIEDRREWKRRHPDFPLTVQANGQWSKKIQGKVHYFGPLDDPDAALRLWLEEKGYLLAGVKPPACRRGITVGELLKAHLDMFDEQIAAGTRSRRTRQDYAVLPRFIRQAGLLKLPVESLTPMHFAALRRVLENSGRSLRSQKSVIVATKVVFNWGGAGNNGMELGEAPSARIPARTPLCPS